MELITMAAIGAATLYFTARKKPDQGLTPFKGKSGNTWLTRTLSVQGTGEGKVSTVQVYAPAGSMGGPHHQFLVVVYSQKGSDMSSRRAVSYGPHAKSFPQAVTEAGKDFGIKKASN